MNVRLRILVSGAVWYGGGGGCARTRDRMTLGNRRWQSRRWLLSGCRLHAATVSRRSTPVLIVGKGIREISANEKINDKLKRGEEKRLECLVIMIIIEFQISNRKRRLSSSG